MVSVVPRDLDAFEIGRGAFVEAVERCDKAHAWQHALSLHQLMLEEGYGYSLSGFHALLMKETRTSFRFSFTAEVAKLAKCSALFGIDESL